MQIFGGKSHILPIQRNRLKDTFQDENLKSAVFAVSLLLSRPKFPLPPLLTVPPPPLLTVPPHYFPYAPTHSSSISIQKRAASQGYQKTKHRKLHLLFY